MTPSVARLIKAYDNLPTASERQEFLDVINKRRTTSGPALEAINESVRKAQTINFAPAPGGCPTCGK